MNMEFAALSEAELVAHRFVPTIVYVREEASFHTRLCIYNYFSELFPQVKTGATVHLWFFDRNGACVARQTVPLAYRGQLQFDVRELGIQFEGAAGVSMVPETLPQFTHSGVGTGYYVLYYDDAGHADFSHEWEHMRFRASDSVPWICVVRPRLVPDTQLVVMNRYYGTDAEEGTARWSATLRNGAGQVLATTNMPPIPPRGLVRLRLDEMFADIATHADREQVLSVEANGRNIQGPFTLVHARNGDFNIHHFC